MGHASSLYSSGSVSSALFYPRFRVTSHLSPLKRQAHSDHPNTQSATRTTRLLPSLTLLIVPQNLVLLLLLHRPLPALLDGIQHSLFCTWVWTAVGQEGHR